MRIVVFIILSVLQLAIANAVFAQSNVIERKDPIEVSDIKTTHIILNEPIKYLDIGSRYFVTDTIENIIKVKHIGGGYTAKPEYKSTNLTLLTTSGNYYSIPLNYNRTTTQTTHVIDAPGYKVISPKAEEDLKQQELFNSLCVKSKLQVSECNIKSNADLLLTSVTGIFYKENYIVIRVSIKNFSTIDLDLDHILFRYKKKKKFAKNAVYQERVIYPVSECNLNTKISGSGGIQIYDFIFEKFVPNEKENVEVSILEKNGGRSTQITIPRKKIINPDVLH